MNTHHLELFYFVARYGGIAAAARLMPYGIQQSAISVQISKLEDHLGVKLFNRRPFRLSPAGLRLYEFVSPFFSNLENIEKELQGSAAPQLSVAASAIVLQDYLPTLLDRVRLKFPCFRLNLVEAVQPTAEKLLRSGEIDIAITLIQDKSREGMKCRPLLHLPLILLVPRKHWLKRSAELWKLDKIEETLIALPPTDAICMQFHDGLKNNGAAWRLGIEVNSLNLIETYVEHGYGIGLSVAIPNTKSSRKVRPVMLSGFPPVVIGAVWAGQLSSIAQEFLAELETESRRLETSA